MSADAPRLYLDHAASSPLVDEAREVLARALHELGANPSSTHAEGRAARRRLEQARERIAACLDAPRDAVVFTSGGTEANALAVAVAPRGAPIAALATEHPSVLRAAEARGRLVTWPVDAEGRARFAAEDGAGPSPPGPKGRRADDAGSGESANPRDGDPGPRTRDATASPGPDGPTPPTDHAPGADVSTATDHAPGEHASTATDPSAARAPAEVADAAPRLVCASLANHETGTIQDMAALRAASRALDAPLFVDGCQAVGRQPVSFGALGCDLLALASHKIGGPPGIGALLVGVAGRPEPLLPGSQEDGLRAGTEPAWLAEAFAAALAVAVDDIDARVRRWRRLRAALLDGLATLDTEWVVNSPLDGLPSTLNVSFPGRGGPALVHRLDLEGVAVSHGAACASGSALPSPVLRAQGLGDVRARSSLRVSLGAEHTDDDVQRFLHALRRALHDVRVRT